MTVLLTQKTEGATGSFIVSISRSLYLFLNFLSFRCLNFANMGKEGPGVKKQNCPHKGKCDSDSLPPETDNNNLLWVARVLELIYEDEDLQVPKFNKFAPTKYIDLGGTDIKGSLKQKGKSRADLWAFAGLVAVELAAQIHNTMCDGTNMTNYCGGQPEDSGYTPCSYQIPLLEFKHGRKDCTTKCEGTNAFYEFCSSASEIHPDPQGNGKSVTSFFKSQFGFTARETIALMGAHAIGHTNEQVSGFRHYPWTPGFRNQLLNNEYYKIIAQPYYRRRNIRQSPKQWDNRCRQKFSSFVGDEHGNPKKTYWVVRSQWQNNDGGPWNW